MLYYDNLESLIFDSGASRIGAFDELIILSGYVNPWPMNRLNEVIKRDKRIKAQVIFGMYGCEGISESLHKALVASAADPRITLSYSTIPIHAKCYLWRRKGRIKYALVGSANFTQPGLTSPLREVLEEAPTSSFEQLATYLNKITEHTVSPTEAVVSPDPRMVLPKRVTRSISKRVRAPSTTMCRLNLFRVIKGVKVVHQKGCLNWGFSKGHVSEGDAYIPIPVATAKLYPNWFTRGPIELVWDDGYVMPCKMEGNEEKSKFAKQISSTPQKKRMGEYFRKRLGVPLDTQITIEHLIKYGRDNVTISQIGDRLFHCDFSTNH